MLFRSVTAAITACLALCAAVWPQAETVEKTPAPSETTAVTTPRPTLPEAEKPVLPVVTEKKESEMPEAESAPEVATEELPIPVPEIEDEAETEQEYVPPTQTDSIPVQPRTVPLQSIPHIPTKKWTNIWIRPLQARLWKSPMIFGKKHSGMEKTV